MLTTTSIQNVTVAITGQPNTGKSTVFNGLTTEFQHVGNWPGKTVEKKSGDYTHNDIKYHVMDLPGTYTMVTRTPEEVIARNYIVEQNPDVTIVMASAATHERSLYFVSEIISLPTRVVVALNMMDIAEDQGIQINTKLLEDTLNVRVVPMIASRQQGLEELKQAIHETINKTDYAPNVPPIKPESDALDAASGRYAWISQVTSGAVKKSKKEKPKTIAQRFDKYATHPVSGTIILISVFLGVFFGSMIIGLPLMMLGFGLPNMFASLLEPILVGILPTWAVAFIITGIFGGLGIVLGFLGFLIVFFAIWAVLDDAGYMARAAYLTHRLMSRIGLHGKSFMPMALCTGCNVAGITGTRIVEGERTRLMTMLLAPLVPCLATTMFLMFLAGVFFPGAEVVVLIGIFLLNIGIIAASGLLISKFVIKGEKTAFILELPEYHRPNKLTIWKTIRHHAVHFLKIAGSIIMIVSIVTWTLAYFPSGALNTSYLAMVGQFFAPLGALMGCDWRWIVALISSIIQKENAMAVLAVLFGTDMIPAMQASLSQAGALAFMIANVIFFPCMGTMAAIASESKSWKWAAFVIIWVFLLTMGIAIVVFQIANLLI